MAHTTFFSGADHHPGFLSRFVSGIRLGFSMKSAADARMEEIERLNLLTDAELAERGLTRDGIPRYVFRDLMGF